MERVFDQCFVVVGAIIEKDGKILLVKEAGKFADSGKWNQPAGWLDVGESPFDAVVREVKEETGYDFKPTAVLSVSSLVRKDLQKFKGETPHPVKLIFTGEIIGEPASLHDDVVETKWFLPEEIDAMSLDELRDLDIKKLVKDYFAGVRYPLELISHTVSE